MTNYNNTDNIIREKYESVDSVFDADALWADIAPAIEKKKKRGFLFWILSVLIVMISSTVGLSLLNVSEANGLSSEIVNHEKITIEKSNLLAQEKESEINNNNSEQIISLEEQEVVNNKIEVKGIGGNSAIHTSDFNGYEHSVFVDNSVKGSILKSNVEKDLITNVLVDKEVINSLNSKRGFLDSDHSSKRKLLKSVDLLPISEKILFNYKSPLDDAYFSGMIEESKIAPMMKKQWRFAVNGGYYIHSRSFVNRGEDISNNFGSRSSEENAKDAYDLGVKLEYFLSDHFVIIGGIRFSQSFVQRKAEYAYAETITLQDHVVTIINTEQGPIELKEDITYDGVFVHKADNYITDTRLGLITGLQYRVGADRWTTHVDLGVELPVWSSQSGVITNNGRPYNLSEGTEDFTVASLQLFGGIGIEYSLSQSTALQATIGGFMPLNNEHVNAYKIEKKSTLLGVNLGLHFRL